jgi:hypothetical protein
MAMDKTALHRLLDQIENEQVLRILAATMAAAVDKDDQAWYWTEEWQAGERAADNDIALGRVSREFDNAGELLEDLWKKIPENRPPSP